MQGSGHVTYPGRREEPPGVVGGVVDVWVCSKVQQQMRATGSETTESPQAWQGRVMVTSPRHLSGTTLPSPPEVLLTPGAPSARPLVFSVAGAGVGDSKATQPWGRGTRECHSLRPPWGLSRGRRPRMRGRPWRTEHPKAGISREALPVLPTFIWGASGRTESWVVAAVVGGSGSEHPPPPGPALEGVQAGAFSSLP